MNIRLDMGPVAPYFSRLLAIGGEFHKNIDDWVHLKNEEDFENIYRVPHDQRYKVEEVYATGRDIANSMGYALLETNTNFSRYPTLTSIIEYFQDTWVYDDYPSPIPAEAERVCVQNGIDLWSVRHMLKLFRKQEELLGAVRNALEILKRSDLYKEENGEVILKPESSIIISGVNGSAININSDGATAHASTAYERPAVFDDLSRLIREHSPDTETQAKLLKNAEELAAGHKEGRFGQAYKDFMQNVANHVSVIAPVISGLSSLL
ncbi:MULTISPECIES: hypothetical protein [Pseudomonas]|jgi:hypothetical protein|uniref:Uncharacterized protein n=1 Tax=Pseudomonas putida (strain ATCC 47054 / DSM 6125 / CFBP 8728 / NCIMB 11950 / KT2440) TaxID=160488 RepID=Q88GL8_PSEPK|nr:MULTISPECIES: hypothetical protein [Pseudomonas]AAN69300.1 conserved protein of unknown function [Pseudomonas putida KT2440]KMU97144.1 hypothetical protein AC138_04815 [Pseudomonas putida]KMY30947.1 hypothetical protein AA993_18900 [Pseudomonas putida]MDD2079535.1 hypothetical protein [Pseudomonas putida]PXZ50302.1 hypothetical protein DM483_11590 [Pseudomonas sp. SMT-1]